MIELNFNTHALARPTSKVEVSALLDETVCAVKQLEAQIDDMSAFLAANATEAEAT